MLVGKPIYMEISFAVEYLGNRMKEFIEKHPAGYVMFGSDSPWTGQKATLDAVRGLGLSEAALNGLLGDNARALLGL